MVCSTILDEPAAATVSSLPRGHLRGTEMAQCGVSFLSYFVKKIIPVFTAKKKKFCSDTITKERVLMMKMTFAQLLFKIGEEYHHRAAEDVP